MDTKLIVGKLVLMEDVIAIIMLADVMPMICGRCYCHLIMLTLWQMEGHSGRCYDHMY